ncbi:MAG: insulinase family protein [Oscillospiraceae bacterium]|nr:insulinase family protein [Oscillospiraceae bacterium]
MYERITLPNGARIVYEKMPEVRGVSLGIWVRAGSRYERPSENGASHFIEHMVFKGTKTRSASVLAEGMDALGGQINAFTAKDCTCFYGRVLDEHLPRLTDMLWDMLANSLFSEESVLSEKGVIFDEINMYEDTPDDLVAERLDGAVFKGSPLARPVLGTKKSLSRMTGESLKSFMAGHYVGSSCVVSLAGSFTEADISDISARFSALPGSSAKKETPCAYAPAFTVKRKPTEQNHIMLGFPSVSLVDDRRYAARFLDEIIGGGCSSRLFQKLREEKGLCYAVASGSSRFSDCGCLSVYAAVNRASEKEALSVMAEELIKLRETGITQKELERVKEQARANLLMGQESTHARMTRLGRGELLSGGAEDTQELIEGYMAVTPEDVSALASETLREENVSFSAVGRVRSAEDYKEEINGYFRA